MKRWVLAALPLLVMTALGVMAWQGLHQPRPEGGASALLGQPAPALPKAGLPGVPPATDDMLGHGQVTLVNFWASWCPPCRAEHPVLRDMAAQGLRIVGVNMRDTEADALSYLHDEGNPFLGVGFDPMGRDRINWGVTAPPETFIIRGDGTVAFRFSGPLVGSDYEQRFLPALKAALAGQ